MTITIRKSEDPFKKYWWVILLAFGGVGAWVCVPMMDTPIGAGSPGMERGLRPADQSLDALDNPQGAPGGAVDLSMEGAYRRKSSGSEMTSSLYQPPPETSAAGSPIGSEAPAASFAQALKAVADRRASKDESAQAARKPFNPPRANFSGLSGFGSGSGGGSGAAFKTGAFGTAKPNVGFATTRGLGGFSDGAAGGRAPVMASLKGAKAAGQSASLQQKGELAKALASTRFDGNRVGGGLISAEDTQSLGGSGVGEDATPMDLKENDLSANSYKYEPVPQAVAPMDTSEEAKRQVMIAIAGALVGGIIGGTAGNLIGMAIMLSATMGRSQNSGSNVAGQMKGKTVFVPARRAYGAATTRYS